MNKLIEKLLKRDLLQDKLKDRPEQSETFCELCGDDFERAGDVKRINATPVCVNCYKRYLRGKGNEL